jgi:hypothetical protein
MDNDETEDPSKWPSQMRLPAATYCSFRDIYGKWLDQRVKVRFHEKGNRCTEVLALVDNSMYG